MSALLLIILSAVLVSMIALTDTGKWRPFDNLTNVYQAAMGLAQAHAFSVPVVCGLTWLLSYTVLRPLELLHLRTAAFAAVVLIVVPLAEVLLRRVSTLVPTRPAFAILLCTNSAALGAALMSDARAATFGRAMMIGIGSALVFVLLLLCTTTFYERLRYADIPAPFRHAPILLISAGMVALAFMGFTGLIQE